MPKVKTRKQRYSELLKRGEEIADLMATFQEDFLLLLVDEPTTAKQIKREGVERNKALNRAFQAINQACALLEEEGV